MLTSVTACMTLLCNCAVPVKVSESGTKHFLVVGVGVVSVNDSEEGVVAFRQNNLGLSLSDHGAGQKLGLGYSSGKVVAVSPKSKNVLVTVEDRPLGDLSVEVETINPTNP